MKKRVRTASLGTKTVLIICVMILTMCIILGAITRTVYEKTIDAEYTENVTNLAETVGLSIDIDKAISLRDSVLTIFRNTPDKVGTEYSGSEEYNRYIANYAGIPELEEYKDLQSSLNAIRIANSVESIYIIYVDPEEKKSV